MLACGADARGIARRRAGSRPRRRASTSSFRARSCGRVIRAIVEAAVPRYRGAQRDRSRRRAGARSDRGGHRYERQDDGDVDGCGDARRVGRACDRGRQHRPPADRRGRRRRSPMRRVIVAEVSSFQLAVRAARRSGPESRSCSRSRPTISTGTGSFDDYVAAKARIASFQTADDLLVFDADDERASRSRRARPRAGSGSPLVPDADGCYRVVGDRLVMPDGRPLATVADMARAFAHDRTNALAAAAAALEVGATRRRRRRDARVPTRPCPIASLWSAKLTGWSGTTIRRRRTPTRPGRAVSSFASVVLLAGGRNKGLDLSVLAARGIAPAGSRRVR